MGFNVFTDRFESLLDIYLRQLPYFTNFLIVIAALSP